MEYAQRIQRLISSLNYDVDLDIQVRGQAPTMANSQFLTNREQGDWAERIILQAVNEQSEQYQAVKSGRTDAVAADAPNFPSFFASYQKELNEIGKRPDVLVFDKHVAPRAKQGDALDDISVRKALAAIEIRSSSFLADKYSSFVKNRSEESKAKIQALKKIVLADPYRNLLEQKAPELFKILSGSNRETFRDIMFRRPNWSSSTELAQLTSYLKEMKSQIEILHKRDYLSITPKLEDIALVNRWIQKYEVPHYYLQVFFDKAYVISFEQILKVISDPDQEGDAFSVERDVKNQQKTTFKVNVQLGAEILGRIDMPQHQSAMRELARGRLLFYVTFRGGKGYLDSNVFSRGLVHGQE